MLLYTLRSTFLSKEQYAKKLIKSSIEKMNLIYGGRPYAFLKKWIVFRGVPLFSF